MSAKWRGWWSKASTLTPALSLGGRGGGLVGEGVYPHPGRLPGREMGWMLLAGAEGLVAYVFAVVDAVEVDEGHGLVGAALGFGDGLA